MLRLSAGLWLRSLLGLFELLQIPCRGSRLTPFYSVFEALEFLR